jgi:hypothetical protein
MIQKESRPSLMEYSHEERVDSLLVKANLMPKAVSYSLVAMVGEVSTTTYWMILKANL